MAKAQRWERYEDVLSWPAVPEKAFPSLGHFSATWSDPRQRALVRSGLRWVLRLD